MIKRSIKLTYQNDDYDDDYDDDDHYFYVHCCFRWPFYLRFFSCFANTHTKIDCPLLVYVVRFEWICCNWKSNLSFSFWSNLIWLDNIYDCYPWACWVFVFFFFFFFLTLLCLFRVIQLFHILLPTIFCSEKNEGGPIFNKQTIWSFETCPS